MDMGGSWDHTFEKNKAYDMTAFSLGLTAVWLVCVVRVSVSCHQVGAGRGSSLGAGAVDHSGFSESLSYRTLYIANAILQSASMLLI